MIKIDSSCQKATKNICFFDFGNHTIQKRLFLLLFFAETVHFDNTVTICDQKLVILTILSSFFDRKTQTT